MSFLKLDVVKNGVVGSVIGVAADVAEFYNRVTVKDDMFKMNITIMGDCHAGDDPVPADNAKRDFEDVKRMPDDVKKPFKCKKVKKVVPLKRMRSASSTARREPFTSERAIDDARPFAEIFSAAIDEYMTRKDIKKCPTGGLSVGQISTLLLEESRTWGYSKCKKFARTPKVSAVTIGLMMSNLIIPILKSTYGIKVQTTKRLGASNLYLFSRI